MKIYFASFLEPENFGPGRKLAICSSIPESLNLHFDGKISYLTPSEELLETYEKMKSSDDSVEASKASDYFNNCFYEQLKSVYIALKSQAKEKNINIIDILPLMDGDTLLSYHPYTYTNYRSTVASLLKKIGYEVNLK